MQFYFRVNVGGKCLDSTWCPLNKGYRLNTGSGYYRFQYACILCCLVQAIFNPGFKVIWFGFANLLI